MRKLLLITFALVAFNLKAQIVVTKSGAVPAASSSDINAGTSTTEAITPAGLAASGYATDYLKLTGNTTSTPITGNVYFNNGNQLDFGETSSLQFNSSGMRFASPTALLDLGYFGINTFIDIRPTPLGIEYGADYSANFSALSLINKGYLVSQLASYVPVSGGTLTGALILAADPTTALGAATKQYVDNNLANYYTKTAADGRYAQLSNNLSDVPNASTARTNLGLQIGLNVEAWSANLDAWSALTTSSKANAFTLTTTGTGAATYSSNVINIPTPNLSGFATLSGTNAWTGSNSFSMPVITNTINSATGALTLQPAAVTGTNATGNNLVLQTGQGTGNSQPAYVEFKGYKKGTASGTTAQTALIYGYVGVNSTSSSDGALWLQNTTPSSTNYSVWQNSNQLYLNSAGSEGINLQSQGVSFGNLNPITTNITNSSTDGSELISLETLNTATGSNTSSTQNDSSFIIQVQNGSGCISGSFESYIQIENDCNIIGGGSTIYVHGETEVAVSSENISLQSTGENPLGQNTVQNYQTGEDTLLLLVENAINENSSSILMSDTTISISVNDTANGNNTTFINLYEAADFSLSAISLFSPGSINIISDGNTYFSQTSSNSYFDPTGILHVSGGSGTEKLVLGNYTGTFSSGNLYLIPKSSSTQILASQGGGSPKYVNLAGRNVQSGASYTVVTADFGATIAMNNTSSAKSVTIPIATGGAIVGPPIYIKDEVGNAATHNITITPTSGTIDGASNIVISNNYGCVQLYFDGTNYHVLSKY